MNVREYEGKLWIISGEIGSGKTVLCGKLITSFNMHGWQISGLRSPAIFENGQKTGIAVENLKTREVRKLAVHANKSGTQQEEPLHWTFDEQVLEWGNQVIKNSIPTDLLVVDEIGPLEMKWGRGWTNALEALDSRLYRQAILVMRPSLMNLAEERWQWGIKVLIEQVDQIELLVEQLMREWKKP